MRQTWQRRPTKRMRGAIQSRGCPEEGISELRVRKGGGTMGRMYIQPLASLCILVMFLILISSVTGNASGIFEMITPVPGSYLEDAIAELRAKTDPCCGSWNDDLVFANCAQRDAYRSTWEYGCYNTLPFVCGDGNHVQRGSGWVYDRIWYQLYRAYGTCSRIGQSIRGICLMGTWDPSQYQKTTVYAPDAYMVTDKNAGSCSGNCDAMMRD